MKRRNADCGKLRRPIKRNKIAEGMYASNTFLYVKYLFLWAVVITADFMLDFRFEFLWPFWLLLRSVYDSFKYKGLAFSILFVCIAITSDLVCLFFIPVSWLFFLASTYVWVQYVWHADKGFCLPTIFLWMLFLYLEGAVRWRDDSKTIPHVDLCRPFAAHCIGYPVVTLGFGVKSYVGYRIRHRKQREVSKENEFYMQLLHLALPTDDPNQEELISQIRQSSEILHSDKLGEIDLPVSSAIIAQRIQQQQLILVAKTSASVSSSTITGNCTSQLLSSNTVSTVSSTSASTPLQTPGNHVKHNIMNNGHHNHHSANKSSNSVIGNGFVNGGIGHGQTSNTINSSSSIQTTSSINNLSHHMSGNSNNSPTTSSINNNLSHHMSGNNNNSSIVTNGSHHSISSNGTSSLSSTTISTSTTSNILNYRNNRRSGDRSDKNFIDPGRSSTIALNNNFKVNETFKGQRVYSSTASATINNCNDSYAMSILKEAGRLTGTITSSVSLLRNRVFETFLSASNNVSNHKQNSKRGVDDANDISTLQSSNVSKINSLTSSTSSPTTTTMMTTTISTTLNSSNANHTNSIANQSSTLSNVANAVATVNTKSNAKDVSKEKNGKLNGHIDCDMNSSNENNVNIANGENIERSRGRRNRMRQKETSAKDNHIITTQASQHVPELKENGIVHNANVAYVSLSLPSSTSTTITTTSNQSKQCENCAKCEIELKKYRNEISQLKQSENEYRSKYEQNITTKSCLQAKQKENEDLEKKILELTNVRQMERQSLQQTERRISEERRLKQSLEAQLNNERKQRKQAEEKAARAECNEICKLHKQRLESEVNKLRRDLNTYEDLKKSADQQNRNYEQELRKLEAELRSRESREGTEVLMNALQAMQDKNTTLEKNLSAETRVKLDLFSALGEAKRQLEIRDNIIRQKDKEIQDVQAKIAQLFAVMPSVPNDSFMSQCTAAGSSILRLNDATLQGPSSPMSHAHISLGGSPLMNQLQNLSVFTSQSSSTSPQQQQQNSTSQISASGQQDQQNNLIDQSSGLDPNATAYTPKNEV